MRIIHTADWHIGQTLNGWPRDREHAAFLDSLREIIVAQDADALIVAGDVFDGINPSGEAQRLLYGALAGFVRARPGLQIILTAGNHDPAQRLEAPEAVLAELGVHVLGTLGRDAAGVSLDRHLLPLRDRSGAVRAHALALPFLRQADLPGLTFGAEDAGTSAVVTATRQLIGAAAQAAAARAGGLPLIGIAHLTVAGALESEGAERRILIGGEHAVPPDLFPADLTYVALGHLHRPQTIAGRLRYAGSPFPLSATEIGHDHGVTLIEIGKTLSHRHIPLPRPVPVLRLPATGAAPIASIAAALAALALPEADPEARPFLYVSLALDRPLAALRAEAEALIDRHPVRLAGLQVARPEAEAAAEAAPPVALAEISEEDLFRAAFAEANGTLPEARHLAAFRDVLAEV
jgi:exonuclease SbcD